MTNNVIFKVKKNNSINNIERKSKICIYNSDFDYFTVRGINRSLMEICNFFSKQISLDLFNIINYKFKVRLQDIKLVKYDSYRECLLNSKFSNYFNISSNLEKGIVSFSDNIIFTIIDILFGGSNTCRVSENYVYELNMSELNIMKKILKSVQKSCSLAWKQTLNTDFEIFNFTLISKNNFSNVFSKKNVFLCTIFKIQFHNTCGFLNIYFPWNFLKNIKNRLLNKNFNNNSEKKLKKISSKVIYDIKIDLDVHLVNFSLSLPEILALKTGDIIPISTPEDDIIAYSNDIPLLIGKYKIYKKKHAFLMKNFFNK
ncbi:hypothetical protein XW81_00370 [Buchnera aphidicola (Schlechtendalia chinensis)]|uniref:Flagellar motor switch protein FliM n=1 Tax=Buchnera aphidicola subsp. Schlechtendalia chinensis TaxID=118110 RepID=A0A172WD44_BUCSC|nr:FliM/FliN family flagellar motor switch protein [Buchnera aphidicola]ANF16889.1 hypothetical protein XW81_00370 [Buchnera aphidicola (Schlechtendalia chinensis)]